MSASNQLLLEMLQKVGSQLEVVYEFAEQFSDEGTLEDLDFVRAEVKLQLTNLQEKFKDFNNAG